MGEILAGAVWLAAASAMAAVSLANCGLAFVFPLEIEIREGTSWLHVLTLQAHISLYDHLHVAYVNMAHGPLDPILKYWLSCVLPFLAPQMVTRIFVLLLPFALWIALARLLEWRWLPAAAAAFCLHLFLLSLLPFHFLIGRSDPAAAAFLALLLAAGHASAGRRALGVGVLAGMVYLLNWRFAPAALACGFAWSAETGLQADPGRRGCAWLGHAAGFGAGFLLPPLAVLLLVFHGNYYLYYEHFFGFFLAPRSWGLARGASFVLFPSELGGGHWAAYGLLLGLLALALARPALPRRVQALSWWPMLAAIWLTCDFTFYRNQGAGGIYYFAPFFLVAALHLARSVAWERLPASRAAVLCPLLLAATVAWGPLWRQAMLLKENLAPARQFLADVRRLTQGAPVVSDDVYFYLRRYAGQSIDMGDEVQIIARNDVYDVYFDQTFERYATELEARPPEFILMAGANRGIVVASGTLAHLVRERYRKVLEAPASLWPNMVASEALYRLRVPSGAKP